jgi:hypothetical protein
MVYALHTYVEAGVGQVQGLSVAQAQVDLAAELLGAAAGQLQHLGLKSIPVRRTSGGYRGRSRPPPTATSSVSPVAWEQTHWRPSPNCIRS